MASFNITKFEDIVIGQSAQFTQKIQQADVDAFAELSGDHNPLHVDKDFAGKTNFGKPVVHGMLNAAYVSKMLGMSLPGPGCVWLSQSLEFLAPAYIGDEMSVFAEVLSKSVATKTLKIYVNVENQDGRKLIEGEAKVKMIELESEERRSNDSRPVVSLVVGSSRGIGAETASQMASRGDQVIVTYKSNREAADHVCQKITKSGGHAIALQLDVMDKNQISDVLAIISKKYGYLSNIVFCASPDPKPKTFEQEDWSNQEMFLSSQVKGPFFLVQLSLPLIRKFSGSSFVFVSSIYADGSPPKNQTSYVVAKAALAAFSRALAVEFGSEQIRFNTVAPGMTETDFIRDVPQKTKLTAKVNTPLKKLARPEQIASTICFLCSGSASHITGSNIPVSGGA